MNRFLKKGGKGRKSIIRGASPLRLNFHISRSLMRSLRRASAMEAGGSDALRRLKQDAGQIEACLRAALADRGEMLPAVCGAPRVLHLARVLVAGGNGRMDKNRLLEDIAAFDAAQNLRMREIQMIPAALGVALCECFSALARELVDGAAARRCAEEWVRRDGRGRVCRKSEDAFLAHALQFSAELERAQAHERLERIIARRHDAPERLLNRVHRTSADEGMRLENLMQMLRLVSALDWEQCFEQLSAVDIELHGDPAGIYGCMDVQSKGNVRAETAYLADCFGVTELALARYALRLAKDAQRRMGEQDPRATICWYILEDAGRDELRRHLGVRRRPRRRVPDASGVKTAALAVGTTLAVLVIFICCMDRPLLGVYALPLAWVSAMNLIGRFYPRWIKPRPMPGIELDAVPDYARTLVVLPVLLSSARRVREMIDRMEELGCLEADKNIDFLLLGDFRDAESEILPDDEEISAAAQAGAARLNEGSDREKYYYLQRRRSFRERDGRWMGENRKRGALMALNALLLDRPGADAAFISPVAKRLAGRYRYVVTLDADTQYLPGTLHKLVGKMLHPLNRAWEIGGRRRGCAVIQPAMQLTAQACSNAYVRLVEGCGGVDSYPVSISEFYQDMTGQGCFAGKGVYDVRAFAKATEGVLRDDEILSHDLIEGILAGAGFANDICFYDGCPDSLDAELMRRHRWIRGDWQLLGVIFSSLRIGVLDRIKMLGNLLRSLYAPALAALLIHSVWADAPIAFSLGLLIAFQEPLLRPFGSGRIAWKRALFKLAVLPGEALCAMDAVLRTLWRLAFTGRHLMDWVPAADASGGSSRVRMAGRIAALLVLPGLLRSFWIPAVLALAALFLIGENWARELAAHQAAACEGLSENQRAMLRDLAGRTWKFFESCVPVDGFGLPPDNLQLDPPVGAAQRTSPTNIGLYLMSCFAAEELGLVPAEDMLRRMESTVDTLEKLEKWNGQLYNWYDIRDLRPLRPRYVSAVDSGNLAAALLMCAQAVRQWRDELSMRMLALAREMNLAALYDAERELFCIGMDAENARRSETHYDLYASEARILSFAAMMLGQAPVRHWKHLSRSSVHAGGEQALVSWSGTMFEYLMPELLIKSCENTLAGQSCRGAAACQMHYARSLNRPWGVSESGYYGFDLQLNYQYRAFGLRALALSGNSAQDVVAPYACALALSIVPAQAANNLLAMCKMGWYGEYGMYEAADYMHHDAENGPRLVMSHMAHHQGMILCALANALCDDVLSRKFMEIPQARALALLLQEKPGSRIRLMGKNKDVRTIGLRERSQGGYARAARRDDRSTDGHLLHGAGTTALVTARGAAHVWRGELSLTRFSGDLQSRQDGMYVHLLDSESGENALAGQAGRGSFDVGSACFEQDFWGLKVKTQLFISPEDGTLYQHLEIENPGDAERELIVTGCFAAALAKQADMRAHPVFQNLFVESRALEDGVLVLRRRQRERGADLLEMIYLASGGESITYETNLEKLVGRSGCLGEAGGICNAFACSTGNVLNPCAALRMQLRIPGGKQARAHFALGLAKTEEVDDRIARMRRADAAERARQLARGHALAVLNHAGVDERRFRLFQRASVLLLDGRLRQSAAKACLPAPKSALWRAGISGDLPIILVETAAEGELDIVREGVRMHAFYQSMGVKMDIVILNGQGADYRHPIRDALGDLIASSHLSGCRGIPGGVFLMEAQNLDEESADALRRYAALRLIGGEECGAQLRAALDKLLLREHARYEAMQAHQIRFPDALGFYNGYGGFDGDEYVILLRDGRIPPAPWCNVLASERAGALVSERGGGFAWYGNSRSGRLTPFANDALREGWGWMFYLMDEGSMRYLRLLPGDVSMSQFCVRHGPGRSKWSSKAGNIAFSIEMQAHPQGVRFDIDLCNDGRSALHLRLAGFVDWLMGADDGDVGALRTWGHMGACFASGAAPGIGCFASDDPRARTGCSRHALLGEGDIMHPDGLDMLDAAEGGWTLHLPLSLAPGESRRCRFLLGCAEDISAAYRLARDFRLGEALRRSRENWQERLEKLRIETPDEAVNLLSNGFLQAQVLNGRIRGRTGLYQPGGAYGFRDQLQDMLPMIHYEPERVRRHLLHCAARQFEEGDVLHWWHEPFNGVRTRISDDLLFLPYVAAQYVRITGDAAVLAESVPFLENIEIPEGREDVYAPMQQAKCASSLHEHCMRAFRRAARTGAHGLCLMGGGDWNDGMNRVGAKGRGESIWLSQFLAVCAANYAAVAPVETDRAYLEDLAERMRAAVETHGWDGKWYLRAYDDEGRKLGSHGEDCCKIDAISQAWAVFAGLDPKRCQSALDSAWEQLADEKSGVIRLLAPPFDGKDFDPGYIAAYPPGIRENGAQYTHAACWLMIALAEFGDAERAHRALDMLLPLNHALKREQADVYRVEPYVMAADIYTEGDHAGRGGWTWYTGSAAWMLLGVLKLLGFERRGNRVRLHALLGGWNEAEVSIRWGMSAYRLICRKDAKRVELDGTAIEDDFIDILDDGRDHTAVFPPR